MRRGARSIALQIFLIMLDRVASDAKNCPHLTASRRGRVKAFGVDENLKLKPSRPVLRLRRGTWPHVQHVMTIKTQSFTIIALCATLTVARAQTSQPAAAAAPPAPKLSSMEQMLKDVKHPVEWLTWGGDLRIRNEYFNNAQTLTANPALNPRASLHSQDYFRFRARVWASVAPVENVTGNVRLAAEPREWMERSSSANVRGNPPGQSGSSGFEGRYGIVDNLNAQWKKPLDQPATLTLGRQDLFMGDGWLMADGTPLDGSWTFFIDAARATYEIPDAKTTIDVIGLVQYAQPDEWMPTIGPSSQGQPAAYGLTDQNEKGGILWIANKSLPELNVDGYFFYKNDDRIHDANVPTTTQGRAGTYGDDASIFTFGGRLSGVVKEHWKYSLEGAYQFGQKQDPLLNAGGANPWLPPGSESTDYRDMNAFGVNSKLSYLFKDKLNNQVWLAYEFLSGDDPDTEDDEMFDVLWGRWPRWSELYAPYSYIPETRTGQMANLHRFGPGWSFTPLKDLDFSLNYNLMFSESNAPTRATPPSAPAVFSGNDNFRGHYLQAILRYKFSKHMTGHLWSEFVFPGHFYQETDQTLQFLRAELMFTL